MIDINTLLGELHAARGDNTRIEVKSAAGGLPDSLTETLSALANLPGGGVIVLGLDENSGFAPVVLPDPQTLKQGVASKARHFTPPVQVSISDHIVDGHAVIVAEVGECPSAQKPCRVTSSRRAYIRGYDGDYRLSELEEQGFLHGRQAPHADRSPVPGATTNDLDPILLDAWRQEIRAKRVGLAAFSGDELLRRAGVIDASGLPSRAGMLSFGKYPQQFYPQFVIRAADLRGVDDGTRARNVTTIDGAIPRMLTATMDWLRTNISTSLVTHADGSVRDVAEYPLAALRELVANALVHRDLESWSEGMAIEMRLQSDRLVITNPGGLYGITVDRLGLEHVTSARNQRLVSLCVDSRDPKDGTRVIEALSTGLTQVAQLLRAAALPPAQFFDSGVSFTVVLHQSQNLKNLGEAKDHRLAVRPDFRDGSQIKLIYETLKSDGPGTVADIAARTSIPASSVRRTLTRLRDDYGVVELQGGRGQNSTWLLRLSH